MTGATEITGKNGFREANIATSVFGNVASTSFQFYLQKISRQVGIDRRYKVGEKKNEKEGKRRRKRERESNR